MKKKYDSSIVYLYNSKNEHVLPAEFRKKIPYSTITGWRKLDFTNYIGYEYRTLFDEILDNALLKIKVTNQKKEMGDILKAWLSIAATIKPLIKKAGRDTKLQKNILYSINKLKEIVGFESALRIFGISQALYYHWQLQSRFHCFDSYISLCAKRLPHQLEKKEVLKMKRLLKNPAYAHWPIISLYAYALRQNILIAGKDSWYKYAKLLGVTRPLVAKIRKDVGLVATEPNEYLHADCTCYFLDNGKKIWIAFVMDNFSRRILGFHISERKTFSIVKTALANALEVIAKHPDQKNISLVTDAGTENINQYVDTFLQQIKLRKITHIIALRDITFSNSPVEAINRIMKGRYLRNMKFEGIQTIYKYISWAVLDYNEIRPHYIHKLQTPHEAYFKIPLRFNLQDRMIRARKRRIKKNKCVGCKQCGGMCKKKMVGILNS